MSDINGDINRLVNKRICQAVSNLLEDADFRLFLGAVLLRSGLESSNYKPNTACEYDEGRRSMGLELLRLCDAVTKNADSLYGFKKRTLALLDYKELEQYYFEMLKEK